MEDIAGADIADFIAEHLSKGSTADLSGAVAGIDMVADLLRKHLCRLMSKFWGAVDGFHHLSLCIGTVCLEVKTSDDSADSVLREELQHGIDDIDNAVVAAGGEDDISLWVADEQKLLVTEIVVDLEVALLIIEALTVMAEKFFAVQVVIEHKAVGCDFHTVLIRGQKVEIWFGGKKDILRFSVVGKDAVFFAIEAALGFLAQINRSIGRRFQQAKDAAGVVIMVVGENDCCQMGKIGMQHLCIFQKGTGCTGVHQDAGRTGFDQHGQAMFVGHGGGAVLPAFVFNQDGYLDIAHGCTPFKAVRVYE